MKSSTCLRDTNRRQPGFLTNGDDSFFFDVEDADDADGNALYV